MVQKAHLEIIFEINPSVACCVLIVTACVDRTKTVEVARAEAEKIKLIGASDASAIECVGKAEAEMMRLKASAYKQYGKAATLSLVLDALPKVHSVSCLFLIYL